MRSLLDALQTPAPVNFRRVAGELHSVAKQASFGVAFESTFFDFGAIFRRFWEPKVELQVDF